MQLYNAWDKDSELEGLRKRENVDSYAFFDVGIDVPLLGHVAHEASCPLDASAICWNRRIQLEQEARVGQ